jgi:hypothetical protein
MLKKQSGCHRKPRRSVKPTSYKSLKPTNPRKVVPANGVGGLSKNEQEEAKRIEEASTSRQDGVEAKPTGWEGK